MGHTATASQPHVAGATRGTGHCSQERPEEGGDWPHCGPRSGSWVQAPAPAVPLSFSPWGQMRRLLGGGSEEGNMQEPLTRNRGRSMATPDLSLICPGPGPGPGQLHLHPATPLQLPHSENGIQSACPSLADARSMIFKWLPVVSCDWQLTK